MPRLTLDRYTWSMVATDDPTKKSVGRSVKKPCYEHKKFQHDCPVCNQRNLVKKGSNTIRKTVHLVNLLYENRRKHTGLYWVTLTTVQHKTGKTDSELLYAFKKWIQHRTYSERNLRGLRYINTLERQSDYRKPDLHFHIIFEAYHEFNIKAELQRLAKLFGTTVHPALFEVKRITNLHTLTSYLAKYVRKRTPDYAEICSQFERQGTTNPKTGRVYKFKPPYSSLFNCRTLTVGGGLNKLYRRKCNSFRVGISPVFLRDYSPKIEIHRKERYFTTYKFTPELWNLAQQYTAQHLEKTYLHHAHYTDKKGIKRSHWYPSTSKPPSNILDYQPNRTNEILTI